MKRFYYKIIIILAFIVTGSCSKTDEISLADIPLSSGANNNGVGASARELLDGTKRKLLIEIQYMPGYELQQQTIRNLTTFLRAHLNKPGGIAVTQEQIPEIGADTKSLIDVARIEQQYRTAFNTDDQVSVNVLVTNSRYTTNKVLGIAFRNTSVCLFGKTIQQSSGGIDQASRAKTESTILNHEFGHLLGLVDLGSPMQTNHRDAAHNNHCNGATCLMEYGVQTADLLGSLVTGTIPVLDANCRNDLRANGGK